MPKRRRVTENWPRLVAREGKRLHLAIEWDNADLTTLYGEVELGIRIVRQSLATMYMFNDSFTHRYQAHIPADIHGRGRSVNVGGFFVLMNHGSGNMVLPGPELITKLNNAIKRWNLWRTA